MTWLGWPARRDRHAGLGDLLEPLSTCADEVELLAGRPCCCLAANGSGVHDGECCQDCRSNDG